MKLKYIPLLLFAILLLTLNCSSGNHVEHSYKGEKIRGLSFVASNFPLDSTFDSGFKHLSTNAVAIMPYAFMMDIHSPTIRFNVGRQWWGETEKGCRETIQLAHSRGYKVMVKPQIWIGRGGFTGHIEMENEENWKEWEENYSRFILLFAQVAEEEKAEIFCLGTELAQPLKLRSQYWHTLIQDLRKIYKGKLTYAENWDCFDQVPFLSELDFIGVNAYFPLSDKKDPSLKEIKKGWKIPLNKMKACSQSSGKPIILTEFGYRSMPYSAKEPWRSDRLNEEVNEELQARLLQAGFEEVWNQAWVAGGFIWKWFPNGMNDNRDRTQFTPQGKKAEKTIQNYFQKLKQEEN